MKRNGWKKLKSIISNYASSKTSFPELGKEELITPLFGVKPTNPARMAKIYSDVLLGDDKLSEKFIFLICAVKKKIFYMPQYLLTPFTLMIPQTKTRGSTKEIIMNL